MIKGLLLAGFLSLTSLARAGVLEWEQTEQVIKTSCGQTVVEAVYPFHNTGDRPVRILRTRSGCSCMTVTAMPDSCEPGARGELRVVFTLGDREGVQRREIMVETDVAPKAPDSVTLVVNIPAWVTLTPRLLWWERNAPAEGKRVSVKIADPSCTEILRISCDNTAWEVRRGISGSDGSQDLWIRPKDTSSASRCDISVTLRLAKQERVFRLFTAVK